MKIECTLKRHGGTRVELFGAEYHFAPNENDGAHVCEVGDESAIERLLSISEAYKEYVGEFVEDKLQETEDPSDYLITDDKGNDVDLGKMTKAQLVEFAKANEISINRDDKKEVILEEIFKSAVSD